MRYLEYNRKVCYVLSTIPNPNSKNPFPGDSYTVSTPYLHISVIFKYIKYQYYYIISTILYYTYHTVNTYILQCNSKCRLKVVLKDSSLNSFECKTYMK